MNKKRIVIYTAIYSMSKDCNIPRDLSYCDYTCFIGNGDPKESKEKKLLPHKYFQDYEISVWIDGNIRIKKNISSL